MNVTQTIVKDTHVDICPPDENETMSSIATIFPSTTDCSGKINRFTEIVEIVTIVIVWYICSVFSSNLSKTILEERIFPLPLSLTLFQFLFVSVFCFFVFQIKGTCSMKKLDSQAFTQILIPLCISQVLAHLLSLISIQQVPVSFTHTVKATSPIFAIMLSKYYQLNEKYSLPLLLSIIPIICGVILSSFTETNFRLVGFVTALASTIVFSWQNTFSKKVFKENRMDDINLLFYTSLSAFIVLLPIWFALDWNNVMEFLRANMHHDSMKPNIFGLLTLNGICHFGQNIAAITFMTRVSPLTYTIFNTTKRLFVIILSILYFGNPIPFFNAVGIALAIGGVVMYNKAKLDIMFSEKKLRAQH